MPPGVAKFKLVEAAVARQDIKVLSVAGLLQVISPSLRTLDFYPLERERWFRAGSRSEKSFQKPFVGVQNIIVRAKNVFNLRCSQTFPLRIDDLSVGHMFGRRETHLEPVYHEMPQLLFPIVPGVRYPLEGNYDTW